MRALILAAGATLIISACKGNDVAENTANTADNSVEAIVANDVTAIDAATNDAANMAADSEIIAEPADNEASSGVGSGAGRQARRGSPAPAEKDGAASGGNDAAEANPTDNVTTNSGE